MTYANHAQFKHRNKTTVRMFTDIDQKAFKLPADEGYKFVFGVLNVTDAQF